MLVVLDGAADGLPDGWLRYVTPTKDSNRARWPVHPAWVVVQGAFTQEDDGLGPIVRVRKREKNIERGLASVIGYLSTLAAWVGGDLATPETDISLVLRWLYGAGLDYLEEKDRRLLQAGRAQAKALWFYRAGIIKSSFKREVAVILFWLREKFVSLSSMF